MDLRTCPNFSSVFRHPLQAEGVGNNDLTKWKKSFAVEVQVL
jgi:hypothetical protein